MTFASAQATKLRRYHRDFIILNSDHPSKNHHIALPPSRFYKFSPCPYIIMRRPSFSLSPSVRGITTSLTEPPQCDCNAMLPSRFYNLSPHAYFIKRQLYNVLSQSRLYNFTPLSDNTALSPSRFYNFTLSKRPNCVARIAG